MGDGSRVGRICRGRGGTARHGNEPGHFETITRHAAELARIRQHLHLAHAQFAQDLRADAVGLEIDRAAFELGRFVLALERLEYIDEMFEHEHLSTIGEHRDVLEAYRMFAHDKGWHRRLREAVEGGLTAEAAVERVQNAMRTRMLRQHDTYWRERQRDLDDLSDRLLRVLAGRLKSSEDDTGMPADAILVARTMGPAELLDYDRSRLRGLVVEDGSSQSHVAVVAKALGIAAIGQAAGIVDRVSTGDAAIVDAVTGKLPVPWTPGDTVAAVTVEGGALYLAIEGRLSAAEVADGLRGGGHADAIVRAAAVV